MGDRTIQSIAIQRFPELNYGNRNSFLFLN